MILAVAIDKGISYTAVMTKVKQLVIKLGTSTLTDGTLNLSRRSMLEVARQAAYLHEKGIDIVIVTSGAKAAGREVLRQPKLEKDFPAKQMLAAVGQVRLMQIWTELFGLFDISIGQILLTLSDFSNRQRYLNVRDTLEALMKKRIIPIINENDPVATPLNQVGDNDNLSALIANMIAADLLILLTDQKGLYNKDPRINSDATLISRIERIDETVEGAAGGSSTTLGTGGMATKIQAAKLASQSGTSTVITSLKEGDTLLRILQGEDLGTRFEAITTPQESRKRWLLSEKPQGSLVVDAGAASKVAEHGASLLPKGITAVVGHFPRGAVVRIVDKNNSPLATGLSNYPSEDIQKLLGTHSNQILEILGYTHGSEIIHRDNMTLIKR